MSEPIDTIRDMIGDPAGGGTILDDNQIMRAAIRRSIPDDTGGTLYNVPAAAADCAAMIAAAFGRDYTIGEDTQFFNRSERVQHYLDLEQVLRKQAGGTTLKLVLAGTTLDTDT